MHGFQRSGLRPRRRHRRQFNRDRKRRAVLRALTGAKLYLAGWFSSLAAAAEAVGAGVDYVRAAIILLRSENVSLLQKVLAGEAPMLAAARETVKLAAAVTAYKAMTAADRKAFAVVTGATADLTDHLVRSIPPQRAEAARALGADVVWDQMVLPLLVEDKEAVPAK
jgi:hypothetical protein